MPSSAQTSPQGLDESSKPPAPRSKTGNRETSDFQRETAGSMNRGSRKVDSGGHTEPSPSLIRPKSVRCARTPSHPPNTRVMACSSRRGRF